MPDLLLDKFEDFPILQTERLDLKEITAEHREDMLALRSDPIAMKYLDRDPAKSLADADKLIEDTRQMWEIKDGFFWGIFWKGQNRLLGNIGYMHVVDAHFRAELGYMLHPDVHRQGIMQECFDTTIPFAFEQIGLHSIEAHVNPNNMASIQLLEKNGFQQEGYFRENYHYNGNFLDTAIYGLIKHEYFSDK